MKKLYLLRHADASRDDSKGDFNRILTMKGIAEVKKLGAAIGDKNPCCELVICSNAVRTRQTFETLTKFFKYDMVIYTESMYNATLQDIIANAKNIDDKISSVLMIGHNPSISEFANYLRSDAHLISFSTANLALFSLDIESWKDIRRHSAEMEWLVPSMADRL